jgi:hypothetical protein
MDTAVMARKAIFLSASEPDPTRDATYWDSRNLVNLRAAVRELLSYVLPRQPLVFGGHPAITPLVLAMEDRIAHDGSGEPQVLMFLSEYFADRFSADVISYPRKVVVPCVDSEGRVTAREKADRAMSLALMRYCMIGHPETPPAVGSLDRQHGSFGQDRRERLGTMDFEAGFFIGGMEGVVTEFNIFRRFHPTTPAWPIASTGSACKRLLAKLELPSAIARSLEDEKAAYSVLIRDLLSGRHPPPRMPLEKGDELDPPIVDRPERPFRRPG